MRAGVRPGARVGVDVGSVRVGVAACDAGAEVVLGVATLPRDGATVAALVELVTGRGAVEVVVGLPVGLSGREGPAAAAARGFAGELSAAVAPVPVRLVDERLSTAAAVRTLQPGTGRPRRSRRGRGARGAGGNGGGHGGGHLDGRALRSVVDQQAAVVILGSALDTEAGTGRPPGELVPAGPASPGLAGVPGVRGTGER